MLHHFNTKISDIIEIGPSGSQPPAKIVIVEDSPDGTAENENIDIETDNVPVNETVEQADSLAIDPVIIVHDVSTAPNQCDSDLNVDSETENVSGMVSSVEQSQVGSNPILNVDIDFGALKSTVAEYEMVPGAKINTELLYNKSDKYLYKFNKTTADGHKAYTCRHSSCKSRVIVRKLDDGSLECAFPENYAGHLHPNDVREVEKLELKNKVKKLCSEIPSTSSGSVKDAYYSIMNTQM